MTQKDTIYKIADYITKNARNTVSTGLYNGKAGMALSLFHAAEYLQDDQIGDFAYNLFQESLIATNNDIGFENGLSGIGYTSIYLTDKEYIEADFNEMFGVQYETILKGHESVGSRPLSLLNSMQTVYFLSKVSNIKKEDKLVQRIISKIFECLEFLLTVQFKDLADIRYINRKNEILDIFSTYLKLVDYSGYTFFSRVLLEDYVALYRKKKIISSLETGYFLSKVLKIGECNELEIFQDVIDENIRSGINNALISPLSLREKIDYARIIDSIKPEGLKANNLLPDIAIIDVEKVIRDLLKTADEKTFIYGYGSGLGRLLVYYTNKEIELL